MFRIVLNCLELSRIVSNLTDFIRIALSNSILDRSNPILGRSNPILDRKKGMKWDETGQFRQMTEEEQQQEELSDV
jgi:hypothetical protein